MTKKQLRLYVCLFLALLGAVPAMAFTDFAVQLTNADVFATTNMNFGVKVAADGTYAATAADDAEATFKVSAARYNDAQHGWVNCTFTIPVEGPVKIGLGNCKYGAQDGTITDAAGNVTALTVGNANCWAANDVEGTTSYTVYKGTAATTLTVKYNGYCPYISVQAADPADLKDDATVTFAAGEADGAVVPAAVKQEVGSKITLPTNFTMYVEGKTLTAWTDGTNDYAPASEYTVPASDVTLTAKFTANEVTLADRTEPVTLKWDFQRKNGAPTVAWEGKTGLVWVTQATIDGKTIDVKADISTSPGKIANANWTDWAQWNKGTTFTIPNYKGAVVSVEAYNALGEGANKTYLTIDGQSDYTTGKTITYNVANTAETIDIVVGDEGSYYRYFQTVLPVPEKSTAGLSFDNVAGTVSWQVGNEAAATVTEDIADAVQSALWSTGSDLKVKTATYFNETLVHYTPANSNAGAVEGVLIEYRVKVAPGLTFKPTSVSYDAVKVGTDGAYFSWGYAVDDNASAISAVAAATILRNSGANSSEANLTHTESLANAGEGNVFALRFYISNTANNKNICIGNVKINGVVNGTIEDVVTHTFAATAAPAEGGSVNVYPAGDSFEEGTELTLTATENFGYDFVNWTDAAGNEVSAKAKFTYTVKADAVLTANFKKVNTYELKLNVDGSNDYLVTISPAPTVVDGKNMYEEGTAVQLVANAYEGLVTFTNWSDGTTNGEKLISMTEDVTLTAFYTETDIVAGWDFYTAGTGRPADFASEDNKAASLTLVNTANPDQTSGWLDKSTLAAGGYESLKGAAVNWRTGSSNGDVGNWHWQTKVNAEAFTDINVQFQMLYNYNAYQTYNVEFSTNGTDWTKAGSINMTAAKTVASFNDKLPEAANNQKDLYIRLIADKTSKVDGTASANDGNALAMFFITGTPKLVDDGKAPALISTVPENGAQGASASGKIVLTFDEKVKVANGATATLGSLSLTPAVSGKTVTFEYKGLEYSTDYTFTLPANSVADLTDNFVAEAISISFTTMTRPTVTKKLYDFIVPDDGSFKEALTAAAARSDKSQRYRIFVKKGNYVIPANQDALVDGTDGKKYADPKTSFGSPNVSIIGEDRELTTVTNELPNSLADNPDAGKGGQANPLEGIRTSGVLYLTSGATDTYFQDIKLWSATADNTGRNVVLVDGGNRTICKNVNLWAYQDTYVSDREQSLYYFEGGLLRGRTDFICGSGDVFFNGVTLQMCEDGGYISVPRGNVKYGYVYKDCTIKGETSKVDGNYYLGRPWTEAAESYFIDTKMEVIPRAAGWAEMSNGGCTRFAEWNSTTANGTAVDLSGRVKSLGKVTANPNNPVLTAEEALEIGNLHNMFGDWDPTLATEQAPVPTNVKQEGNTLTWDNSNYALLWAVEKDGSVIDFTIEPTYTVTESGVYTVRAANEMGGLSESSAAATVTTGIENVNNAPVSLDGAIYNLQGVRVNKAVKGVYIINGKKVVIK